MSLTEERPEQLPDDRLDELERDVRRYRLSRDAWTLVVFGVAIVLAVAAVLIALRDDGGAAVTPSRPQRARRSRPTSVSSPSRCRRRRSPNPA